MVIFLEKKLFLILLPLLTLVCFSLTLVSITEFSATIHHSSLKFNTLFLQVCHVLDFFVCKNSTTSCLLRTMIILFILWLKTRLSLTDFLFSETTGINTSLYSVTSGTFLFSETTGTFLYVWGNFLDHSMIQEVSSRTLIGYEFFVLPLTERPRLCSNFYDASVITYLVWYWSLWYLIKLMGIAPYIYYILPIKKVVP